MTDTLTTARSAPLARPRPASARGALAIVLTGQFMALLDASVVNVAAPSIHTSLHASGSGLQLVIAGYVITYAVLLVTGARLGDILGHRRMFLAGVALFTLASLGCGLAGSTGVLVTLRFVQGVGAATMIPQVLSLIQRSYPGPARARPAGSPRAGQPCSARRGGGLPAARGAPRDPPPRAATPHAKLAVRHSRGLHHRRQLLLWSPVVGSLRSGLRLVVVGKSPLERLHALGDVAHDVGNLAFAAEQQQRHRDDRRRDRDAERGHALSGGTASRRNRSTKIASSTLIM